MDGDVARCQQRSLLLSSDSQPLTCRHSGKFSCPHSDTSSLRPSTAVCCSERPTPTAASHFVVTLQPLEISFCRTHEAEGFCAGGWRPLQMEQALLRPLSLLHTDRWPPLESRPSWLPEAPPSLLPPPADPSSSAHLCVWPFWSFVSRAPALSIILFLGDATAAPSGSRYLLLPQEHRTFSGSSSALLLLSLK